MILSSSTKMNVHFITRHRAVALSGPSNKSRAPSGKLLISHAVVPGSQQGTQRFIGSNGYDSGDVPLGPVQHLPPEQQQQVVIAILGGLGLSTNLVSALSDPGSWAGGIGAVVFFGLLFVAAGWSHFKLPGEYESMMPEKGAWGGLWNLPGDASWHVQWTGVAEILGGLGLLLSLLDPVSEILPVRPVSSLALFWLVVAVTPANIYMATHNAPGPGPKGTVLPIGGHLLRLVMQVALLTSLWGVFEASL